MRLLTTSAVVLVWVCLSMTAAAGTHPPLRFVTAPADSFPGATPQYGFDDGGGDCGKGNQPTPEEKNEILDCLAVIAASNYALDDGTIIYGSEIAEDLEGMLNDGRLGRGDGGVNDGCTEPDGLPTSDGDQMNITDWTLDTGGPALCATLAHEWLHTRQTYALSVDCAEAQAYELWEKVYVSAGGTMGDWMYLQQETRRQTFEANCNLALETPESRGPTSTLTVSNGKLPDSNAPSGGGTIEPGSFGNLYLVNETAGQVILWRNDAALSTAAALPLHLFFAGRHVALSDHDVLVVFGADTTVSSSPVGVMSTFDADTTQLFDRNELAMTGTKYPSGVDYDPDTGWWYVLDTHFSGSGITIWHDTNSDGVPETEFPAAFATPGFPGLDGAKSVAVRDHPSLGSGLIVTAEDLRAHDLLLSEDITFLRDTDHDGVADVSETLPLSDFWHFPPTIAEIPTDGATQLQVKGMPNHFLEVWRSDASGGSLFEPLGTITSGLTGLSTIPLSRALVAGWYVVVVDVTLGIRLPAAELVVPVTAVVRAAIGPGLRAALHGNPARGQVVLEYEIPQDARVWLSIYDVRGHEVARLVDGLVSAGRHEVRWSGLRGRAAGVYWYRLVSLGRTLSGHFAWLD